MGRSDAAPLRSWENTKNTEAIKLQGKDALSPPRVTTVNLEIGGKPQGSDQVVEQSLLVEGFACGAEGGLFGKLCLRIVGSDDGQVRSLQGVLLL